MYCCMKWANVELKIENMFCSWLLAVFQASQWICRFLSIICTFEKDNQSPCQIIFDFPLEFCERIQICSSGSSWANESILRTVILTDWENCTN